MKVLLRLSAPSHQQRAGWHWFAGVSWAGVLPALLAHPVAQAEVLHVSVKVVHSCLIEDAALAARMAGSSVAPVLPGCTGQVIYGTDLAEWNASTTGPAAAASGMLATPSRQSATASAHAHGAPTGRATVASFPSSATGANDGSGVGVLLIYGRMANRTPPAPCPKRGSPMQVRARRLAVCLLAACLLAAPAGATNFEIAPVLMELSPTHLNDSVRIINRDDHVISIQVRGYEWSQVNGEDRLEADTGVLLSPPVFTLAPGAVQLIRILAKSRPGERELSYRLLIDQIPAVGEGVAINFKFRVSMPVFLAPTEAAAPRLEWRIVGGLRPFVEIVNQGNRRVKLTRLSLTMPDGQAVAPSLGAHAYVLAGSTRRFPFIPAVTLRTGGVVQVAADSEAGEQRFGLNALGP